MAVWVGLPKSYTPGRNRPVQYVVIHATDNTEGPSSAEAGASWDKRRTDGTSTHILVDSDSAVREVQDADRAHHARYHGNEIGLGVEICGYASQTAAQWDDDVSRATLQIAAREVAQMCRDHGLPPVRLSVAEVRAAYYAPDGQRPKGICGHIDVTRAYPEDNGTHTDPGSGFPWDRFLAMVAAEMGDDDMIDEAKFKQLCDKVDRLYAWLEAIVADRPEGKVVVNERDPVPNDGPIKGWDVAILQHIHADRAVLADIKAAVSNLAAPEVTVEIQPAQLDAVTAAALEGARKGIAGATISPAQ